MAKSSFILRYLVLVGSFTRSAETSPSFQHTTQHTGRSQRPRGRARLQALTTRFLKWVCRGQNFTPEPASGCAGCRSLATPVHMNADGCGCPETERCAGQCTCIPLGVCEAGGWYARRDLSCDQDSIRGHAIPSWIPPERAHRPLDPPATRRGPQPGDLFNLSPAPLCRQPTPMTLPDPQVSYPRARTRERARERVFLAGDGAASWGSRWTISSRHASVAPWGRAYMRSSTMEKWSPSSAATLLPVARFDLTRVSKNCCASLMGTVVSPRVWTTCTGGGTLLLRTSGVWPIARAMVNAECASGCPPVAAAIADSRWTDRCRSHS
mmetsp:Transcript_79909/g.141075  ORF Transcript_79909/g.141075 Transcript_79909/m.141075 type:complete len:324 (-) Transcript_79909:887-1858(-)